MSLLKIGKNKLWKTRKRLVAIGVGLVFTLLIIEGLLRLGGWSLGFSVKRAARDTLNKSDLLLVCTGDSHTKGIGAAKNLDYPSRLEELLRKNYPDKVFQVVNLGKNGSNSSEAVNRVLDFLEKSKKTPDLVIFQCGKNNDHNFHEATYFQEIPFSDDRVEWTKYFLSRSRTYQLSQITVDRLKRVIRGETADESLHYDNFFNVAGDREIDLLRDWTLFDIQRLQEAVNRRSGHLILLNYWLDVPWITLAYQAAQRSWDMPIVNILAFRLAPEPFGPYEETMKPYLNLPDLHPNAKGYALIADLVGRDLIEFGFLPKLPNGLQLLE